MLFEKVELERNEKVLKMVRKHWFIIVAELFAVAFVAALPFIAFFVLTLLPENLQFIALSNVTTIQLIVFGVCAWLLFSFLSGFMIWTNYYLDVWLITDRRIIYIDQRSFFNRNVSMFRLERLQDIEITTVGIIQTFLNFGTLSAQTAGSNESNFISAGLPDPRGLQSTIQRAMDMRLKRLHSTDTAAIH